MDKLDIKIGDKLRITSICGNVTWVEHVMGYENGRYICKTYNYRFKQWNYHNVDKSFFEWKHSHNKLMKVR
jgi:hypothetical protein